MTILYLRALVAAAFLLGASGAVAQTVAADEAVPTTADADAFVPVAVPVRALGRDEAPYTIDLYASFICNTCAKWYADVLPELKTRYIDTGQARLVFHDIATEPLVHSVRTAGIGLCAEPARFFDVAEAFMSGLPAVRSGGSVDEWYAAALAMTGREKADLETCAASEVTYNQVRTQNQDLNLLRLSSFPGVIVNGQVVQDPTFDAIAAAMLLVPPAP